MEIQTNKLKIQIKTNKEQINDFGIFKLRGARC